jgi:NADH:ubiquinone oxidoreductase subunit 5 (subunit L)/multisubunit Na+/H+ antiporter MnhA subunit
VSALLTAAYSIKLLLNAFVINHSGSKKVISAEQGLTVVEASVLGTLCFGGIISGYIFKDMFVGFGSALFDLVSLTVGGLVSGLEPELLLPSIKTLPLLGSILVTYVYIKLYGSKKLFYTKLGLPILESFRFYYNEIINTYLSLPVLNIARYSFEQ